MAEVARRHPDVELMLCASGGGRSDLATLRWFHELWTSDNTDPVERVPWLDPDVDHAGLDRTPGTPDRTSTIAGGRIAWPSGRALCATVIHIPARGDVG